MVKMMSRAAAETRVFCCEAFMAQLERRKREHPGGFMPKRFTGKPPALAQEWMCMVVG